MEKSLKQERKQKSPKQIQAPSRQNRNWSGAGFSVRWGQYLAPRAERLGGWTYNLVRRHWLGIVNLHLLAFVAGALAAPLLTYLDQQWIPRVVYGFYGLFCHQEPSRCLLLFGNQTAICSRCLSFYSALLVCGLWVSLKRLRPLSRRTALALAFPAAADVLLQSLHITQSTNLIRITTGCLLGMAVSLYLLPRAQRSLDRLTAQTRPVKREKAMHVWA